MLTYYPQLWAEINIRPEDFQRRHPSLVPPDVSTSGDPTSKVNFFNIGFPIVLTSCKINFKSYREGNSASLEFPATRLPIDPRVIRQASIKLYGGVIDPTLIGSLNSGHSGDNKPVLIPKVDLETGTSNELFRGFIDDWKLINDDDGSYISIECRDVTGFFIDAPLPVETIDRIPKTLALDDVIRLLIEGEADAVFPGASTEDRLSGLQQIDVNASYSITSSQIASNNLKLTRIATSIADATANGDLGGVAELVVEQTRLLAKQATLNATLATQGAARVAAQAQRSAAGPLNLARLGLSGSKGIKVVNNTGGPLPAIGDIKGSEWFNSSGSLKKSKSRGTASKMSYWDFITDLCVGSGYICYIRTPETLLAPVAAGALVDITPDAEIVIDHPRTYYAEISKPPRRFIYGFNVNRLELSRDYNSSTLPKAVVVSAIEDETGKTVTYKHPPTQPKTNKATIDMAGSGDREDVDRYIIRDRIPAGQIASTLKRYAESVYDQLYRAELQVAIETSVLSAYEDNIYGPAVADMFQLRPADPIEVQILSHSLEGPTTFGATSIGEFRQLDNIERRLRLIDLGINPALANAIGAAEESELFQRVFRVQAVTLEYDAEQGCRFNIDAINYLDVSSEGGQSP